MPKIVKSKRNIILPEQHPAFVLKTLLLSGRKYIVRSDEPLANMDWVEVLGEPNVGDDILLLPSVAQEAMLYLDEFDRHPDSFWSGAPGLRLLFEELLPIKFINYPPLEFNSNLSFYDLPVKGDVDVEKTKDILSRFMMLSACEPASGIGLWVEDRFGNQIPDDRLVEIYNTLKDIDNVSLFGLKRYVFDYLIENCYNLTGMAMTYRDLVKMTSGLSVAVGVPSTFMYTAKMFGKPTVFLAHNPVTDDPVVTANCRLDNCKICTSVRCSKLEDLSVDQLGQTIRGCYNDL